MTRAGRHPMEKSVLRRLGRLMQIHHLTHQERVAARHGVTATYVRQQASNLVLTDTDDLLSKLDELADRCLQESVNLHWRSISRRTGHERVSDDHAQTPAARAGTSEGLRLLQVGDP